MFCQKCGKELPDDAKFCQYCGWQNQGVPVKQREQKSQFIAIVLCLFTGLIGLHDFYLNRNFAGVTKLLIAILLGWMAGFGLIINGIWCFFDFIAILFNGFEALKTDKQIEEDKQRECEYQKRLRGEGENKTPTAELLIRGVKEDEKDNN